MESRTAVVVAAFANLAVAITKFAAAAITSSSAMLSEGIHSVVDTIDQLLLLFGEHRSRKPADEEHPFGYGHELYFWTLVVSILIFGVGGGISFYEGLLRALAGEREITDPLWSYVVLGVSAAFEGISWAVGLRKMNRLRRGRSLWRTFRESKDPALLTVVVEDSAALLGLLLAFLGVLGSHALRAPILDSIASMCIGLVLAGVSLLLARESRSLLVGEAAGKEAVSRMRGAIARDPAVVAVGGLWTMQLAPEEILVNCEVEFRRDLAGSAVESAIDRIEDAVRKEEPRATRIFLEAESVSRKRGAARGTTSSAGRPSPGHVS